MLNWDFKKDIRKKLMFDYYKDLIKLRKKGKFDSCKYEKPVTRVDEEKRSFIVFTTGNETLYAIFNLGEEKSEISLPKNVSWNKIIASREKKWNSPVKHHSAFNSLITITAHSFAE